MDADSGMPLDYHIGAEEGLITVQGKGRISPADLARLGQALLTDADYEPRLPQLLDFRGLRPAADGTLDVLQAFVSGLYRQRVEASVAVVIDDHLESRHCADIFLLTCAVDNAELFCDYDQALKWLMRHAFAPQPVPAAALPDEPVNRA